jgi:hypothetical protein
MAVIVAAVVLASVAGGRKRRFFPASNALEIGSVRPDDLVWAFPEIIALRHVRIPAHWCFHFS